MLFRSGSKYLQDHYHQLYIEGGGNEKHDCAGYLWSDGNARPYTPTTGPRDLKLGNSGNLQPYLTVYMWKRIS